MITLHSLADTSRPSKRRKVVGRGPGSNRGKTSCRGQKGDGSRSGYKRRYGYQGGGVPLHRRVPTRGFSNVQFACRLDTINLGLIDKLYTEGETVSLETLRQKRYIKGDSYGIKVLGEGTLTKKLTFQVEAISENAKAKLKEAGIEA